MLHLTDSECSLYSKRNLTIWSKAWLNSKGLFCHVQLAELLSKFLQRERIRLSTALMLVPGWVEGKIEPSKRWRSFAGLVERLFLSTRAMPVVGFTAQKHVWAGIKSILMLCLSEREGRTTPCGMEELLDIPTGICTSGVQSIRTHLITMFSLTGWLLKGILERLIHKLTFSYVFENSYTFVKSLLSIISTEIERTTQLITYKCSPTVSI